MSLTQIDPEVHVLKDTPTARLFRRVLKCSDVVTFFHTQTGQWVLGYWVHQGSRLVDEMEDLGPNFEYVNDRMVSDIRDCWKRVDWAAKKKQILGRERDRRRRQAEDQCEDQERWAWMKGRTAEKAPMPYTFEAPH